MSNFTLYFSAAFLIASEDDRSLQQTGSLRIYNNLHRMAKGGGVGEEASRGNLVQNFPAALMEALG